MRLVGAVGLVGGFLCFYERSCREYFLQAMPMLVIGAVSLANALVCYFDSPILWHGRKFSRG
jgi:hypothetical protein